MKKHRVGKEPGAIASRVQVHRAEHVQGAGAAATRTQERSMCKERSGAGAGAGSESTGGFRVPGEEQSGDEEAHNGLGVAKAAKGGDDGRGEGVRVRVRVWAPYPSAVRSTAIRAAVIEPGGGL